MFVIDHDDDDADYSYNDRSSSRGFFAHRARRPVHYLSIDRIQLIGHDHDKNHLEQTAPKVIENLARLFLQSRKDNLTHEEQQLSEHLNNKTSPAPRVLYDLYTLDEAIYIVNYIMGYDYAGSKKNCQIAQQLQTQDQKYPVDFYLLYGLTEGQATHTSGTDIDSRNKIYFCNEKPGSYCKRAYEALHDTFAHLYQNPHAYKATRIWDRQEVPGELAEEFMNNEFMDNKMWVTEDYPVNPEYLEKLREATAYRWQHQQKLTV